MTRNTTHKHSTHTQTHNTYTVVAMLLFVVRCSVNCFVGAVVVVASISQPASSQLLSSRLSVASSPRQSAHSPHSTLHTPHSQSAAVTAWVRGWVRHDIIQQHNTTPHDTHTASMSHHVPCCVKPSETKLRQRTYKTSRKDARDVRSQHHTTHGLLLGQVPQACLNLRQSGGVQTVHWAPV